MKATAQEIEKYLNVIAETPPILVELTKTADALKLETKPEKYSWSVNDILAHLRACADLWGHSIYAMLAEKEPVLPDINERKWAKVTGYSDVPFAESLQVFSMQRENLVRVLQVLPFESWEKSAIIFGRKHTVFTQVRRLAKHETEHLEQIKLLLQSAA